MIYYTKNRRKITVGVAPGFKFIAKILRNEDITEQQIVEKIVKSSTLSEGDVLSCLRNLQLVMTEYLTSGSTIRLENLGTFTPYLESKACESIDEVTENSIKGVKIRFIPNVRFKKQVSSVQYEYRHNETIA
ncbi:MAG: HU family DNA-binding protein [Bacteroidales bacterium]|nr:HU family DNA-binding protein [Bacteroidales bacterium]